MFFLNLAVYGIMLGGGGGKFGRARQVTDDNMLRRMKDPSCMSQNARTMTRTHNNISFPRHQQLRKRASILRCMYIACPVNAKPGSTRSVTTFQ